MNPTKEPVGPVVRRERANDIEDDYERRGYHFPWIVFTKDHPTLKFADTVYMLTAPDGKKWLFTDYPKRLHRLENKDGSFIELQEKLV